MLSLVLMYVEGQWFQFESLSLYIWSREKFLIPKIASTDTIIGWRNQITRRTYGTEGWETLDISTSTIELKTKTKKTPC